MLHVTVRLFLYRSRIEKIFFNRRNFYVQMLPDVDKVCFTAWHTDNSWQPPSQGTEYYVCITLCPGLSQESWVPSLLSDANYSFEWCTYSITCVGCNYRMHLRRCYTLQSHATSLATQNKKEYYSAELKDKRIIGCNEIMWLATVWFVLNIIQYIVGVDFTWKKNF